MVTPGPHTALMDYGDQPFLKVRSALLGGGFDCGTQAGDERLGTHGGGDDGGAGTCSAPLGSGDAGATHSVTRRARY